MSALAVFFAFCAAVLLACSLIALLVGWGNFIRALKEFFGGVHS